MGTWKTPAQVPLAPPLRQGGELDPQTIRAMYEYVKKMANVLSSLRNDLEFMINGNLDVQNVRAQGIETRNLKSGSVTTDILAAGAVTADKISVNELSAISANMGEITAGTITGALIRTDESGQRIEFSSQENLLKAMQNENDYVALVPDESGFPVLATYDSNTKVHEQGYDPGDFVYKLISYGSLLIQNTGELTIRCNVGDVVFDVSGDVIIPFTKLRSTSSGSSLDSQLDDIWDEIDDLWAAINSSQP